MPLPALIVLIESALSFAPEVAKLAEQIKGFVSSLFGAGIVTKSQQDAIHQYVDAQVALLAAGVIPACLKVDTDPK